MRPHPHEQISGDCQGYPLSDNPPFLKVLVQMSNSILIFYRKDVGHRLLDPMAFGRHFLLLVVLGLIVMRWPHYYELAPYGGYALIGFAILMQFRCNHLRQQSIKANLNPNAPLHSMSRGHSYSAQRFAKLRIKEIVVQRVVEPLYSILVGCLFINAGLVILGSWWIVAGISLAIVELVVAHQMNHEIYDAQDARAKAQLLQSSVPTLASAHKQSTQTQINQHSHTANVSPELASLSRQRSRRN